MPPANQSSKAALVTWTVICTVFGIVCLVVSLLLYARVNDAEDRADRVETAYSDIIPESEIRSADVESLNAEIGEAESSAKALPYAMFTRNRLAGTVAQGANFVDAENAAEVALNTAAEATGSQPTSLTGAIDAMSTQISNLQAQLDEAGRTADGLRAEIEQNRELSQTEIAAREERAAQAEETAREAVAEAAATQQQLEEILTNTDEAVAELVEALKQEYAELDDRYQNTLSANATLTQQRDEALDYLNLRVGGSQLVTQSDGEVIRTGEATRLTINRGRQDGVNRGLTFEIYDRVRGVPAVDINNPELPRGKASVEVVSVGPTSSEARIIFNQPGQTVQRGDLIANLAYDPNTDVRFRIYGEFDLENDGNPSTDDRERFESIVEELGGEVVPDVTVDTDIVVLGREPEVPDFTEEELEDATNVQIRFAAIQARQQYEAVLQKARDLNKSVLNQNQALYYLGYFDQGQR